MKNKPESIWKVIAPVKKQVYLSMALLSISVLLSLVFLYTLAYVIQGYLASTQVDWLLFFYLFFLTVVIFSLRGLSYKKSHVACFTLESIIRQKLASHLANVSLGTVAEIGTAELSTIIQDDVNELHTFVADGTPLFAIAYTAPFATALALFFLDWRLALLSLSVLAVGMFILSRVTSGIEDLQIAITKLKNR